MNRVISWVQSIRLRQIFTVVLVAIAFLFSTSFGNLNNQLIAHAKPLTPEAEQYHSEGGEEFQNAVKNSQESGKSFVEKTTENIVEKLNLNEETPRATKEFFHQAKENTQQAVKSPQIELKGSQD